MMSKRISNNIDCTSMISKRKYYLKFFIKRKRKICLTGNFYTSLYLTIFISPIFLCTFLGSYFYFTKITNNVT